MNSFIFRWAESKRFCVRSTLWSSELSILYEAFNKAFYQTRVKGLTTLVPWLRVPSQRLAAWAYQPHLLSNLMYCLVAGSASIKHAQYCSVRLAGWATPLAAVSRMHCSDRLPPGHLLHLDMMFGVHTRSAVELSLIRLVLSSRL